jgi:hypothetical protein
VTRLENGPFQPEAQKMGVPELAQRFRIQDCYITNGPNAGPAASTDADHDLDRLFDKVPAPEFEIVTAMMPMTNKNSCVSSTFLIKKAEVTPSP